MAINTSILKSYAPEARRDFIAAVKTRAARFGITGNGSASIQEQGEVAIINGQAYPRTVARQCRDLENKIRLRGFDPVMEEVAYTWFNRFAAIRYMELHGYLDHGFRVLSHPSGETSPEIIQHAEKAQLPGLNAERVVELKLDGRKDEDLYRMLLVAQCNALHAAMPFLFERINDETELLLPDNLLHSDSVVRQMVSRIPESDWQEIEIIGWLYQFYISEKKDQVMGKVVKSEDIPAATQLFTPNWIVKYMVQNSLGAKWLATYPDSPIKAKMEYYIEPAEQPDDVRRQIEAETPSSLDPEQLTFLDPANGSGHILVEAYDLFKEFYLERGYRLRDIPRLILEKNLFGLDIDDRAAQLSGFALMMRARADDRRILAYDDPVTLNVLTVQESNDLDEQKIVSTLWPDRGVFKLVPNEDLLPETVAQPILKTAEPASNESEIVSELVALFQDARTYGSLIQVPESLVARISALKERVGRLEIRNFVESTEREYLVDQFLPLVRQAELLGAQYDVVAANPPYMGSKGMNTSLKTFAGRNYPDSKPDLFAMFMERCLTLTAPRGLMAMINMQSWMFLSSYEKLREKLLSGGAILSMAHLGERAFDSIGGAVVSTTAFVIKHAQHPNYKGGFVRLVDGRSEAEKSGQLLMAIESLNCGWFYSASAKDFKKLPGNPIAYWVSKTLSEAFSAAPPFRDTISLRAGLSTGDNQTFQRQWHEVSRSRFHTEGASEDSSAPAKWFPCHSGGEFRKWYGNHEVVLNWENDGLAIKSYGADAGRIRSAVRNEDYYFREGITWSKISSGSFAARFRPKGFLFDDTGRCGFADNSDVLLGGLGMFCSTVTNKMLEVLCPTLSFTSNELGAIPLDGAQAADSAAVIVRRLVSLARSDWDSYETSWDFIALPLFEPGYRAEGLAETYQRLRTRWQSATDQMKLLEEENNHIFIDAYGLQEELRPNVPIEEITLTCNPAYRYGVKIPEAQREDMLRGDTMREFISYAVGCMLGRYSLDEPGLILANQGDTIDDYLAKVPSPAFMPDADNIIPMLDDNWFEDDVTDRFMEFLKVTFGSEHFDENLAFIENAIGKDIRKFFKRDFLKDHLSRYKRRPIYWVFSSGKEKAFEAIVYMHRYNETTLARMRMNYVVPLQSQMTNRIERLATELSSPNLQSSERKRKDKQRAKLIKQLEELGRFEEELRHLADQRIQIDLDDGVRVNYGKFGNLLADVKKVTGEGSD